MAEWLSVLQDLRTGGATQIDLIVTDGHEGLLAAVQALFSATPRQPFSLTMTVLLDASEASSKLLITDQ